LARGFPEASSRSERQILSTWVKWACQVIDVIEIMGEFRSAL